MLKFNIFLPLEPVNFDPPTDGRSSIRILVPVVLVFGFLFFITGGASWFPLFSGGANQTISAPQSPALTKVPPPSRSPNSGAPDSYCRRG
jgi:hypothetical protein